MIVGSYLGGVAFLKGLGLVHAISHMVGAEYNTHHGLTNAIILPAVMEYNLPGLKKKLNECRKQCNSQIIRLMVSKII